MTSPTPAEMARAAYDEAFAGPAADDEQVVEVLRIPGFAQAWREARTHLASQPEADAAA